MIAWVASRPLIALLALAAAAILVVIGVQTGFGTRLAPNGSPAPGKAPPVAEAKLVPPIVAQAPEQAFPEMAARPLFTPTRRPAPPEPTAGKSAFQRGQYVLQGVIVVGDQRTALLKEKTSGKIHRVDRGNEVNGITVEAVEPTEVTLASGGEREKVALVVQRPEVPGRTLPPPVPVTDPNQAGPFTPQAAQPPPAPPATTTAPVAEAPHVPPGTPNPAARTAIPGRAPVAGSNQPSTQPMTPEELLARRRARRNQPTTQ